MVINNKLVMLHRDRDRQQPLDRDRFPANALYPSIPSFLLEQSRNSSTFSLPAKILMPVIPISFYVLKSTSCCRDLVLLSSALCSHDHFAKNFMLHPPRVLKTVTILRLVLDQHEAKDSCTL